MVGSLTKWSDRGDALVIAGNGNGGGANATARELYITVMAGTNEDETDVIMTGWASGRVGKVCDMAGWPSLPPETDELESLPLGPPVRDVSILSSQP